VEAGPERAPSVARGGAELPPELAGPAVAAVKLGGDDGLGVGGGGSRERGGAAGWC
jgi:hypothetical protein